MECQQGSPIHFSPIGNHAAVQPTAQVLGDEIHQEDEKWVWPRSIMLHRSQQPLNNHKHSFQHSCEEDPRARGTMGSSGKSWRLMQPEYRGWRCCPYQNRKQREGEKYRLFSFSSPLIIKHCLPFCS